MLRQDHDGYLSLEQHGLIRLHFANIPDGPQHAQAVTQLAAAYGVTERQIYRILTTTAPDTIRRPDRLVYTDDDVEILIDVVKRNPYASIRYLQQLVTTDFQKYFSDHFIRQVLRTNLLKIRTIV